MGEVASWLSGDGRHCLLIYKCQLEKAIREIVNGSWMAMHSIGTGQIKVLKRNTIICCWLKCETCVRTACRYFLYPSLHRKLHESRLANSVVRCSAARGQSNSVVFANILSSEHYVWIYIFLQLRKVIFILRRSFKHRIIYLTDMAIMCASTIISLYCTSSYAANTVAVVNMVSPMFSTFYVTILSLRKHKLI